MTSGIVNVVGIGGTPTVSAAELTQQECYDRFNNKDIDAFTAEGKFDQLMLNPCVASGYCKEAGPGTVFGSKRISCRSPAIEAAARAVVAPLIKAVCGVAPPIFNQAPGSSYVTCSNKVTADYNTCVALAGANKALDTPTNVAKCFIAQGNNISVNDAKNAIINGRTAGDVIIAKAALDKKTADCTASGNVIIDDKCVPKPPETPKSTCVIDGVGWIICPVVNFMAKIADGAFGFLADNFLATSPKIFDSPSTFKAWSIMRTIANAAFVVAFLIIIYSQLTSVGITNYGVKKMLPRLIIAAILVNLSYFVCQLAVDLSNILGYSIKSLLEGLGAAATGTKQSGAVSHFANGTSLEGVAGTVLAIGAGAAIVYALLSTLVPVLLAAVVALIMILFILVARQALIVILIVLSPLAFVAYLLPNTEQWFKKWQKMFVAMLMLFPIIALVFGMSSLAAAILTAAASFDSGFESSEANTMFAQIIAAAVVILPLFVVPGLLKKALDGAGNIGAKMNGVGDRLGGALGKKGSEGYSQSALGRGRELKKQGKQEFRNRRFNDAMAGGDNLSRSQSVRRALGRGVRPVTESGEFARNRATRAAAGASTAAEDKDYNEAVAAATAQQKNMTVADVADMAATGKYKGNQITEQQRAAAIDKTMVTGGFGDRQKVLVGLAGDKANTSRELRNRAIKGAYAKGDQNIYGVTFGDQILDEGGTIGGATTADAAASLAAATVKNAADGNIQAEHLVQGSSATSYLVNSTLASTDPGAANAKINLRNARATKASTPSIQGKSDSKIDASLATL